MRDFLPVIAAFLLPLAILALLLGGVALGGVRWQPAVLWTTRFGNLNQFEPNAVDGVVGLGDNVYAAGVIGPIVANSTPGYFFLSRYSSNGQLVWTQHFGTYVKFSYSNILAITVDSSNVYLGGNVNGSGNIEAFDLSGNRVWSTQFGNSSAVFHAVSQAISLSASNSDIYMGGHTPINGTRTTILSKYDSQGNLVWTVALGKYSQVLIGGIPEIAVYSNAHGIFVVGSGTALRSGTNLPYVLEYGFNGTLVWSQGLNTSASPCSCYPKGIAGDSTGLFVAGDVYTYYGSYGFLRKYDWNGNMVWAKEIDSPDGSSLFGGPLATDGSGVYLSTASSGGNLFMMRYDDNGNPTWSFSPSVESCGIGPISVGDSVLYGGGACVNGLAFLGAFGLSSTLILFGLNPPSSFAITGVLAGLAVVSVLFLRRRYARKRRPKPTMPAGARKLPAD